MFAKPIASSGFFKPADHVNDLAILLEPKKVLKDQPHNYDGIESIRDIAIADMAIFKNSADIENASPSEVLTGVQITNQVLVADIERNDWIGKAALVVVRKVKRPYVWREPEFPGAEAAAAHYYKAREAEREKNADEFPLD